jgi:hypothetical protein
VTEASGRRSGGTLLLGLLLAALGLWWLLALVADVDLPARIVLPVLVIVTGLTVVLMPPGGARVLLIIAGIALAFAATAAQAVEPTLLRGGVGDRNVVPAGVAERTYRLGIGQLTVDLRDYQGLHVKASVGVGEVLVYTPPLRVVAVRSHVGLGETDVFGITRSGVGADLDFTATGKNPPLVLDVEAGIGQVRVVRG